MVNSSRNYFGCIGSLLALLLLPLMLNAQQTGTLFNHYNIRNGLIMNNVDYIHIDNEGFVILNHKHVHSQ